MTHKIVLSIEADPNTIVAVLGNSDAAGTDPVNIDLKSLPAKYSKLPKDLAAVFAQVNQYAEEAGQLKCATCPAHCCTTALHSEIALTAGDVRRLARHLGMSFDEVVAKYLHKTEVEGTGYEFKFVKIPKKYTSNVGTGHACPFLKLTERESNTCSVYEARPDICRAYSATSCEYYLPVLAVRHPGKFRWSSLPAGASIGKP